MRSTTLTFLSVFLAATALAQSGFESPGAGFVFVTPKQGTAALRATPSVDAKVVGQPPNGARLVYRKYMQVGNDRTWYWVEPPGGTPGWIRAEDVSSNRPTTPPAGRPIQLLDVDAAKAAASSSKSMTAAARGLDGRAKAYGELQNMELTVKQFVSLEHEIGVGLDDLPDDKGLYNDQADTTRRKAKANEFKLKGSDQ